jgi:hypothetical protein
MNPTPDTPENPLKRVAGGVSNLLQQVSPISAADFNRWRRMAEQLRRNYIEDHASASQGSPSGDSTSPTTAVWRSWSSFWRAAAWAKSGGTNFATSAPREVNVIISPLFTRCKIVFMLARNSLMPIRIMAVLLSSSL